MTPSVLVTDRSALVTPALVKVQVTVSPASALKVAVAVPTLPVLLVSSQLIVVRAQPAGAVSVEVYWPGATVAVVVQLLVEIVREGVSEEVKVPVPPAITFLTLAAARLVSVKVQVTVSPAAR